MKQLIFLVFTLLLPAAAQAQVAPTAENLARAIFRAKTGSRGDIGWRECNRRLSRREAALRAHEIGMFLMEEKQTDPEFDPWIAAAIIGQESSYNRCAISRGAWQVFNSSFEERLERPVRESDIRHLLRNRSFRQRLGLRNFDAGLAQFRWPGTIARRVGMTDPGELIDTRQSIRMLAESFRVYRGICETTPSFSGNHTYNSSRRGTIRVVRYNIPCSDGYWVAHNTGGSWFNYRYYRNVKRWEETLLGHAESTTIEDYDGNG